MALSNFSGVVMKNAPAYLRGAFDLTTRRRILWALARQKGRIKTGYSSFQLNWQAEVEDIPIQTYGDMGLIEYATHDVHRRLTLDWRGYVATHRFTLLQSLMSQGNTNLIKETVTTSYQKMAQSLTNRMNSEMTVDGDTIINRFQGLETFLGHNTGFAVTASDKIAIPLDSYATRTTAPAQEGNWSAAIAAASRPYTNNANFPYDWPDGTGDPQFDWHTPLLLNYTSTRYGGSTWAANGEKALREMATWQMIRCGESSKPDLHLMTGTMFNDLRNSLGPLRQIIVPHKESQDLGFGDTLQLDGVGIYYDIAVPVGTFYTMAFDAMEVCILGNEVLKNIGPFKDPKTLSDLMAVGLFGNNKFIPKCFGKGFAYA